MTSMANWERGRDVVWIADAKFPATVKPLAGPACSSRLAAQICSIRWLSDCKASLPQEHVCSTVGEENHKIHNHQEKVVMPARSFLAPESRVPYEDFFLDGSQHDENESDRGELSENAKGYANPAGDFCNTQENGEAPAHSDAFTPGVWIFQVAVATGNENHPDHETHQQQAQVSESRKLRKHSPLTICSWFDVAGTRPVAENPEALRKWYSRLRLGHG